MRLKPSGQAQQLAAQQLTGCHAVSYQAFEALPPRCHVGFLYWKRKVEVLVRLAVLWREVVYKCTSSRRELCFCDAQHNIKTEETNWQQKKNLRPDGHDWYSFVAGPTQAPAQHTSECLARPSRISTYRRLHQVQAWQTSLEVRLSCETLPTARLLLIHMQDAKNICTLHHFYLVSTLRLATYPVLRIVFSFALQTLQLFKLRKELPPGRADLAAIMTRNTTRKWKQSIFGLLSEITRSAVSAAHWALSRHRVSSAFKIQGVAATWRFSLGEFWKRFQSRRPWDRWNWRIPLHHLEGNISNPNACAWIMYTWLASI